MEQNKVISIIKQLQKNYPNAKCSLDFHNSFELLIAVILSAQCTDERVNKTTPSIFKRCPTPEAFVSIPIAELEQLIHPCGFYKNKAKNIKLTCEKIITTFHGKVPQTMEELMTLPGVGRKTANVVMLEAFNKPMGIAVDTHAKRLSQRLGLSLQTEPEKIEKDLLSAIPIQYWKDVNHLFIYHGRAICNARLPKCEQCSLRSFCSYFLQTNSKKEE